MNVKTKQVGKKVVSADGGLFLRQCKNDLHATLKTLLAQHQTADLKEYTEAVFAKLWLLNYEQLRASYHNGRAAGKPKGKVKAAPADDFAF